MGQDGRNSREGEDEDVEGKDDASGGGTPRRGRGRRRTKEEEEEEERLMSIRRGLLEKKIEEEIRPLTLRRGMKKGEEMTPGILRDRKVLIKEEDVTGKEEAMSVRRARIIKEIMAKREEKKKQEEEGGEWKKPKKKVLTEEEEALLKMKRKRLLKVSEKPSVYYSCTDDTDTYDFPAMISQSRLDYHRRLPHSRDSKEGVRGSLHSQEEDQYFSACESLDPLQESKCIENIHTLFLDSDLV